MMSTNGGELTSARMLGTPTNYPFERMEIGPGDTYTIGCFMHGDVAVERIVLPRAYEGKLVPRGDVVLGIQVLASDVEYARFASLEGPSAIPETVARVGQSLRITLQNVTNEKIVFEGAFARVRPILGRWVLDSVFQRLADRGRALLASEDTAVYAKGWNAAIDELFRLSPTSSELRSGTWAEWANASFVSRRG